MTRVYTGGSSGGGFGGSSGSGWDSSNPADVWRASQNPFRDPLGQPKPGSQAWYQQQNSALGGGVSPVFTGSKSPTSGKVTGSYSGGGSYGSGGYAGNEWYMPEFQVPLVDRSVYENLANDILNSQLSSLGALRSSQEAQATSSEKAVRGDYFDQYRQAQYNRAGRGMGGSPMGSGEERQVQLAMADTLGNIRDTLAGNLNQIGSQEAQARAQKNINAEQMFQQQQAMAFDQAVKQYQLQMQKMGMEFDMAQSQAYGSGGSALEQNKQAQLEAEQQQAQVDAWNREVAFLNEALEYEKDPVKRNDIMKQRTDVFNKIYTAISGGNSSFQPYSYTPETPKLGTFEKLFTPKPISGSGNSYFGIYG